MSSTSTLARPALAATSIRRSLLRWLPSFLGFPLGGLAAMLVTGPVDGSLSALLGGLLTGLILGAAQAWGLRAGRRLAVGWALATAVGMAAGLVAGGALVGFGTDLTTLTIRGAICGLAVGLSQLALLLPRLGPIAFGWPAYLAGAWAIGWLVTTAVGVRVGEQFTVFGAAGAVTVTLLTGVLPLALRRGARAEVAR